jgi:hypothetical protein
MHASHRNRFKLGVDVFDPRQPLVPNVNYSRMTKPISDQNDHTVVIGARKCQSGFLIGWIVNSEVNGSIGKRKVNGTHG